MEFKNLDVEKLVQVYVNCIIIMYAKYVISIG